MKYPKFLQKGDTIGITAPSDGNRKEMDFRRLDLAIQNMKNRSHEILETENVRTTDGRGRSSSKEQRARQFMSLICNPEVKYIVSAKGGDFLMEILPLLDYEEIEKNPTWFQGFSDNTGLTYTITTLCDMATVYGNHFNDFAMEPWHEAVCYNYQCMTGDKVIQKTFDGYEDGFYDKETPEEGYHLDKKSICFARREEKELDRVTLHGRLLGGCLDVLLNLVGTRFDKTGEFIKRYQKDGILWYLESFSLDSDSLTRGLWQLKEAGWFDTAKGFVFGRPCMFESFTDHNYVEAVEVILSGLQVPILFDADIGHKSPQFTIVNGAMGTFDYEEGKLQFSMEYK